MVQEKKTVVWLRLAWPGLVTWVFSVVVLTVLSPRAQAGALLALFLLVVLCLSYVYASFRVRVAWSIRLTAALINLSAVLPAVVAAVPK